MPTVSGPRFGATGAPGSRTLASAQCVRFARLVRRMAATNVGSAATAGSALARVTASISSKTLSGASSRRSTPVRISSATRGGGRSHMGISHTVDAQQWAWCPWVAGPDRASCVLMSEHVDVLIVGAGLSGIGAAWHLQDKLPGKTYAILEAREASGGTWDLFRYPGIRSDSDLSTFAYAFKPWTGDKQIADGPEILRYLRDTAEQAGIDEHIRYGHRVVRASWSTEDARWTVEAQRTDTGEAVRLTASWLFCASGYYRYDEGFTPRFPGLEDFGGR